MGEPNRYAAAYAALMRHQQQQQHLQNNNNNNLAAAAVAARLPPAPQPPPLQQQQLPQHGGQLRVDALRELARQQRQQPGHLHDVEDDEEDVEEDEGEDEAEEEEDDEDEDEEDDEDHAHPREGLLDGGMAEPIEAGGVLRESSKADITLYLTCSENFPEFPNHPVLRSGVTVQIGLDTRTRLSAVFNRYVDFCNEVAAASATTKEVDLQYLEFVHCQLLSGSETVEAAALMKNDRVTVRREQSADRRAEAEQMRIQKEIDTEYFQQLRSLASPPTRTSSEPNSKMYDVLLDCQGMVQDEQDRAKTTVYCHSVIMKKRCPWLYRQIQVALEGQADARHDSEPVVMTNTEQSGASEHLVPRSMEDTKDEGDDDDDDGIETVHCYTKNEAPDDPAVGAENQNIPNHDNLDDRREEAAAEIENDEEDEDDHDHPMPDAIDNSPRDEKADDEVELAATREENLHLVRAIIPDHGPAAVKILLEYCYTNRVVSLGHEAFVQACRTKPGHKKYQGPVLPYATNNPRKWPARGDPTVPFAVILSALELAEKADIPRLSFMCEIAATQLVSNSNVVDALAMCEKHRQSVGNPLSHLRMAAMDVILRWGSRGIFAMPQFQKALQNRSNSLVPTLLSGVREAVENAEKKRKMMIGGSGSGYQAITGSTIVGEKRDWQVMAYEHFDSIDKEDLYDRQKERHKRRVEREKSSMSSQSRRVRFSEPRAPFLRTPEVYDVESLLRERGFRDPAKRKSLKRMAHHLSGRLGRRFVPGAANPADPLRPGGGSAATDFAAGIAAAAGTSRNRGNSSGVSNNNASQPSGRRQSGGTGGGDHRRHSLR